MIDNSTRQILSVGAFVAPTVIGACLMPMDRMFSDGWAIGLPALGCALIGLVHKLAGETVEDEKERLARTPELRPQHPRERMMAFFRSCPGGRPTLKQAQEYIASHQWWKPPYCKHREIAHCKDCPLHRTVDTIRKGDVLLGTHIVKDCRDRDPVCKPMASVCQLCKHCRPHSNDEFHDCEIPLRTADSDRPCGMDYYLPYYYPKKDGCPCWKPFYTREKVDRNWRHRHDGDLLMRVMAYRPDLNIGSDLKEDAEAALDEFIRVSTPGSPESTKSYTPDWFLREQAGFMAKCEAEAKGA